MLPPGQTARGVQLLVEQERAMAAGPANRIEIAGVAGIRIAGVFSSVTVSSP
jgi:hypothetical protein